MLGRAKRMVRRQVPIITDADDNVGGISFPSTRNKQDMVVNVDTVVVTSAPTTTAQQAKSIKSRKDKSKGQPNTTNDGITEDASSILSSSSLLQLQSDVGKLFAMSEFMMKRMDFYEKQMELFWNAKQNAELNQLLTLYQQQVQQLVDQAHPTNTAAATTTTTTTSLCWRCHYTDVYSNDKSYSCIPV
jgi:hypothetical protein